MVTNMKTKTATKADFLALFPTAFHADDYELAVLETTDPALVPEKNTPEYWAFLIADRQSF